MPRFTSTRHHLISKMAVYISAKNSKLYNNRTNKYLFGADLESINSTIANTTYRDLIIKIFF